MKTLLSCITIFVLFACQTSKAEEAKPVMAQIGEDIRKVTAERPFTNDDAAHVAQHLFVLMAGPFKENPFADVTEPDAKHIEVNVGYDLGIVARSYHVRFFREPIQKQLVYIESITVANNNI